MEVILAIAKSTDVDVGLNLMQEFHKNEK